MVARGQGQLPKATSARRHAECLIDLRAARTEQKGNLCLRHAEFDRNALALGRLTTTERDHEKARQPNVERVERDGFQLIACLSEPLAKKSNQSLCYRGTGRP
jgi:hypothetical protein